MLGNPSDELRECTPTADLANPKGAVPTDSTSNPQTSCPAEERDAGCENFGNYAPVHRKGSGSLDGIKAQNVRTYFDECLRKSMELKLCRQDSKFDPCPDSRHHPIVKQGRDVTDSSALLTMIRETAGRCFQTSTLSTEFTEFRPTPLKVAHPQSGDVDILEDFGANLKSYSTADDRWFHFLFPHGPNYILASAMGIMKEDEILMINGISVTRKHHDRVVNMFKDLFKNGKMNVSLLIRRRVDVDESGEIKYQFVQIEVDITVNEELIRVTAVSTQEANPSSGGFWSASLNIQSHSTQIHMSEPAGTRVLSSQDSGFIASVNLSDPKSHFSRATFNVLDLKSGKDLPLCMFKQEYTGLYITVSSSGDVILKKGEELDPAGDYLEDSRLFVVTKSRHATFLESATKRDHFLSWEDGTLKLKPTSKPSDYRDTTTFELKPCHTELDLKPKRHALYSARPSTGSSTDSGFSNADVSFHDDDECFDATFAYRLHVTPPEDGLRVTPSEDRSRAPPRDDIHRVTPTVNHLVHAIMGISSDVDRVSNMSPKYT